MNQITVNLTAVQGRIDRAAAAAGRDPGSVRLLAVSKRHPADAVVLAAAAGQKDFGENFVQEGVAKRAAVAALSGAADEDLCWHFIGRIQRNKTRQIATHFDVVHTLDRIAIARRLDAQREGRPLRVFAQVSLDGDPERGGASIEELPELLECIDSCSNLALQGLMVLPPPTDDVVLQREGFARVAGLARDLASARRPLGELSMGMSGDLEAAIAEGATWIRIGTAIFGPRPG
ncbi:MAG: YggS family pyridoxal phosphate-dependent enzyme [Xanthomonadales bacterium]|nr:YggS family pyridoxal phosphate-dependent enzyme [Xanthomonadales bacterium]